MSEKLSDMVCIRVTAAEKAMLEALKARLEPRLTPGTRITDRALVLTACDRLAAHLDRLDRGRARYDAEGAE